MSLIWSLLGSIWNALPSWRAPTHQGSELSADAVPGSKRGRSEEYRGLFSTDVIEIGAPVAAAQKRMRSFLPSRASKEHSPTAHWRSNGMQGDESIISSISNSGFLWSPVPDLRPHRHTGPPVGISPHATIKDLQGLTCRYPDREGTGVLTIEHHDLQSLAGKSYINDTIIDYYIKAIEAQHSASDRPKMLFWNCFFYKKLTERSESLDTNDADAGLYGFQNIKRWTGSLRCLDQDYIFVPIHGRMHWSLAVVCHPGALRSEPCPHGSTSTADSGGGMLVLHLDPLQGDLHSTTEVTALLRGWLRQECAREGLHLSAEAVAERSRGIRVKTIPQQTNSHDCGPFVLTYLEYFAANPPANIVPASADSPELLCFFPPYLQGTSQQTRFLCKNWFPEHNPAALRVRIMRQLLQLLEEQAPRSSLRDVARDAALTAARDLMRQLDVVEQHGRCYEAPVIVPAPAVLEAPPDSPPAAAVTSAAEGDSAAEAAPLMVDGHASADGAAAAVEEGDTAPATAAASDSGVVVVEGPLADVSEEDVVEMLGARAEGEAVAGGDAVPAVAAPAGEEALGLEAVLLAMDGRPAAGAAVGDAVAGFSGEGDELGVLDLWHPDDLWQ